MDITFAGAAGTVTGSKYLVSSGEHKWLVDCGMFQGLKELRLRNWAPLPFDPASLEAVLLTHAHIDHSGALPILVREGFAGKIRCSSATRDLCAILLPDAGHLQEEEAWYANRKRFAKHAPALPLFTRDDAEVAMQSFLPVQGHTSISLGGGVSARFLPAGHILGASMVRLEEAGTSVLFSGDLGRPHNPIMKAPTPVTQADFLVIESTYGNRLHDHRDPNELLAQVIHRTCERGGVLVVPAFCVGRAQELLYLLSRLKAEGKIPNIPVYLNSPMARDTTEIYRRHEGEHRLSHAETKAMCTAATIVNTVDESKALNDRKGPMIVIAGSGMATGGRIVHHLAAFAPDPKNTILFAGFQAAGTRGRAIVDGAEFVKIHGEEVPIRAEVTHFDSLSAHVDADEMMSWLRGFKSAPRRTFITHGEPAAAEALRLRIEGELGWRCHVPAHGERVSLHEGSRAR